MSSIIDIDIFLKNLTDNDFINFFENIDFSSDNNNIEVNNNNLILNNDICPECKTVDSIIEDTTKGINVCKKCGQVINTLFDYSNECRNYEDDKGDGNANRYSGLTNKMLQQSSLGSNIGGCNSRIKTLHIWSAIPYRERSIVKIFEYIKEKCHKLKLQKKIEDDAKILYKRTVSDFKKNENYIIRRGVTFIALKAASVYIACKKNSVTRSIKEIAEAFEITTTELAKGCKTFIKYIKKRNIVVDLGTSAPEHFVLRFCNDLMLKKEYCDEAVKIAKNISRINLASDHTPFSVATCSIMLMAENHKLTDVTRKILAEKFDISEVTIGKTYKKIKKYNKILLDDKIVETIEKKIKEKMDEIEISDKLKNRFIRFNIPYKEGMSNIDNFKNKNELIAYISQISAERKQKRNLIKKFEKDKIFNLALN